MVQEVVIVSWGLIRFPNNAPGPGKSMILGEWDYAVLLELRMATWLGIAVLGELRQIGKGYVRGFLT